MNQARTRLAAVLGAAGVIAASPSIAAAFFGWRVASVPVGDTLNVRAYPNNKSAVLVAYPNGTHLSLTGRCTGGLQLNAISGQPSWRQQQTVRSRWCEVWLDPTGSGAWRAGWVHGRFIHPL